MALVGDVALMRLNMELDGRPWSMGFHYQAVTVTPDMNSLSFLGITFGTALPDLQAALSAEVQFCSAYATTDSGALESPSLALFANTNGSRPGNALPVNNAAILRLRQTVRGARFDGRVFISGIAEADTELNNINVQATIDSIVAFAAAANFLSSAGGLFQWRHVIKGTEPPPAPPDTLEYRVVDSSIVNPTLYTQRRRTTRHLGTA